MTINSDDLIVGFPHLALVMYGSGAMQADLKAFYRDDFGCSFFPAPYHYGNWRQHEYQCE